MVLVISSKHDSHINLVASHFEKKGISWVRMNTEDFPRNVDLSFNPEDKEGFLFIKDSQIKFKISDIKSVWYRKPEPFDISHFEVNEESKEYLASEFNEVLQGLYAILHKVKWINHPLKSKLPHRKMLQLSIAKNVGFKIPETIISNNQTEVFQFAESLNWELAIKSIGALSVSSMQDDKIIQYGIYTRKIDKEELMLHADKIQYMPTMFQEYIEKDFEIRVTCVKDKIFGCKIHSQLDEKTKEDMRFNIKGLKHEFYDCSAIEERILNYMNYFNLEFACFDFAVTPQQEVIFFECNPNGQWQWIEDSIGSQISKAIADYLTS